MIKQLKNCLFGKEEEDEQIFNYKTETRGYGREGNTICKRVSLE